MGIRQYLSAGKNSIVAYSVGDVTVRGSNNQVAGRGASNNVFSNGDGSGRNEIHANLGNIELISDGSIAAQVDIRIEQGRLYINGQWSEL